MCKGCSGGVRTLQAKGKTRVDQLTDREYEDGPGALLRSTILASARSHRNAGGVDRADPFSSPKIPGSLDLDLFNHRIPVVAEETIADLCLAGRSQ
jgi:hypothetical protein